MTLKMRQGLPPFIADQNGHIPMFDDSGDWLAIVTREALEAITSPPGEPSLERLLKYSDVFGAAATYKLEHGRAGDEQTIWVQVADVREYRDVKRI
jgi:hypothetical protein